MLGGRDGALCPPYLVTHTLPIITSASPPARLASLAQTPVVRTLRRTSQSQPEFRGKSNACSSPPATRRHSSARRVGERVPVRGLASLVGLGSLYGRFVVVRMLGSDVADPPPGVWDPRSSHRVQRDITMTRACPANCEVTFARSAFQRRNRPGFRRVGRGLQFPNVFHFRFLARVSGVARVWHQVYEFPNFARPLIFTNYSKPRKGWKGWISI